MNTLAKIRKFKHAFYRLYTEFVGLEQLCLDFERLEKTMRLDKKFTKEFEQLDFDLKTLTEFLHNN